MAHGTSASCELPENNGKMTGHNNTDVSTTVIDQGQGRDTKRSVEMTESGPQAQENRAISSGAAAILGDKDENDYLVIYPNDNSKKSIETEIKGNDSQTRTNQNQSV